MQQQVRLSAMKSIAILHTYFIDVFIYKYHFNCIKYNEQFCSFIY